MASESDLAFIPTALSTATPKSNSRHASSSVCRHVCRACGGKGSQTRRSFLKKSLLATTSLFFGTVSSNSRATAATTNEASGNTGDEPVCQNCYGKGTVACELCSGTGFWRALQGNDPKQKYKGVVCPECEGSGALTCPVCLGTGEGDVRGLLRRRTVQPGPGRILQSN